jgi:hypothetical protein
MPISRTTGMALIALGMMALAGTTNQLLPAMTFFPAFLVCSIGAFVFMKANRVAMADSEAQTLKRLNPELKNKTADRFADAQAQASATALESVARSDGRSPVVATQSTPQVERDELVLYEVDGQAAPGAEAQDSSAPESDGFVVTHDVSFPLEVQEQNSLAEQLEKLKHLLEEEIISEDEFAVAKAKLLS